MFWNVLCDFEIESIINFTKFVKGQASTAIFLRTSIVYIVFDFNFSWLQKLRKRFGVHGIINYVFYNEKIFDSSFSNSMCVVEFGFCVWINYIWNVFLCEHVRFDRRCNSRPPKEIYFKTKTCKKIKNNLNKLFLFC